MKKLFIVVAVAVFGLTACKKDLSCDCTGSFSTSSFKAEGLDKDEQDAFETACDAANTVASIAGESCKVN
jgi:hypothetical protein